MIWHSITWIDIDGNPIRREVLNRPKPEKIWAYIEGRIHYRRIPEGAYGVWFSESMPSDTWDEDINEAREPSNHAEVVPVEPLFDR